MNTLIDNTSIHNLRSILDKKNKKVLTIEEIIQLLYFGEHILLSDNIDLVTFSISHIRDITFRTLYDLNKITNHSLTGKIIKTHDFNEEVYTKACIDAGENLACFLKSYSDDKDSLITAGRLATSFTRVYMPEGNRNLTPIVNWFFQKKSEIEINEIIKNGLVKKAYSAFDYIIAKNQSIIDFINDMNILSIKDKKNIANLLDTILRVYLNQELARYFQGFYSPSPQRGEIVYKFMRHEQNNVTKEIKRKILNSIQDKQLFNGWNSYLLKNQGNSIPIFLIHLIGKKFNSVKGKGSLEKYFNILLEIREEDKICKRIRNDLTKLQLQLIKKDFIKYEKNMLEIDNAIADIINTKTKICKQIVSLISEIDISSFIPFNPIKVLGSSLKKYTEISETRFFKFNYLSSIRQSFVYDDVFFTNLKDVLGINQILI